MSSEILYEKGKLDFVGKEKICETNNGDKIRIPEGSEWYRCKSDCVKFYGGSIPKEDGYVAIPSDANFISFPEYEKHMHNTHYGEAEFYKE